MKISPCYKKCNQNQTRTHYHCLCGETVCHRFNFLKHLRNCKNQKKHAKPPFQLIHQEEKEIPQTPRPACEEHQIPAQDRPKITRKQSTCEICNKMSCCNINLHMREVHRSHTSFKDTQIIYVSPTKGLFMVTTNLDAPGNKYPIHVKYYISSSTTEIFCEAQGCISTKQAFSLGRNKYYSCKHVAALTQTMLHHLQQRMLRPHNLDELCNLHTLNSKFKKKIKDILDICSHKGLPPVINASITPSSSFLYLSIFCDKTKYHSKLGRVVVHFSRSIGPPVGPGM